MLYGFSFIMLSALGPEPQLVHPIGATGRSKTNKITLVR